jgi:hypothetical protein
MDTWIIQSSGKYDREHFEDDREGMNFCKARSLRSLCAFSSTGKNNLIVYEHGEIVGGKRREELFAHVEEMFNRIMEREIKVARGKRSVKKQS